MGEIVKAEASDGSIKVQSPQETPTPKSAERKDSETSEPKPKRKSPVTSKASEQAVEVGHQGRVVSQWDNPKADPNLRKHVGESPNGEGNDIA